MNCEPCINHGIEVKLKRLNSNQIIDLISEYLNVRVDKIKGKSRYQHIVEARQICCYVLRSDLHLNLSLKSVGFIIGHRDHTTVIHSVRTISDYAEVSEDFKHKLKAIYLHVYGTLKYFVD